jgi:hypothetical protein
VNDSIGKGSGDTTSSEAVTKLILSTDRSQVCEQLFDPDKGLLFHEKHMAIWLPGHQKVDFQIPYGKRAKVFNGVSSGKDLEIRQAPMVAMSGTGG